jgi:hypothetical protein
MPMDPRVLELIAEWLQRQSQGQAARDGVEQARAPERWVGQTS